MLLGLLPGARSLVAQPIPEPLLAVGYTLEHQSAGDAIALIYPLLSERGVVELKAGTNSLLIRDTRSVQQRVRRLLGDFDRPPRAVRLEVRVVNAWLQGAGGEPGEELPEELAARLRDLLRYASYRQLASADLAVREGETVSHRLGEYFELSFRLGAVLADRRVRLEGFRLHRRESGRAAEPRAGAPGGEALIHTNLNLWLDRPMILGLARAEASPTALMLILNCRLAEAPRP